MWYIVLNGFIKEWCHQYKGPSPNYLQSSSNSSNSTSLVSDRKKSLRTPVFVSLANYIIYILFPCKNPVSLQQKQKRRSSFVRTLWIVTCSRGWNSHINFVPNVLCNLRNCVLSRFVTFWFVFKMQFQNSAYGIYVVFSFHMTVIVYKMQNSIFMLSYDAHFLSYWLYFIS